jgi:hypothetical protein
MVRTQIEVSLKRGGSQSMFDMGIVDIPYVLRRGDSISIPVLDDKGNSHELDGVVGVRCVYDFRSGKHICKIHVTSDLSKIKVDWPTIPGFVSNR